MTDHKLADLRQSLADTVSPIVDGVDRGAAQVNALAHQGVDAVRDGTRQLQAQARHASDSAVHYIQAEPFKAVLIAAATGAALMALVTLMARSSARH